MRDQGQPLDPALRDEHTVERVAMYRRQATNLPRVVSADIQGGEPFPVEELFDVGGYLSFAQSRFDGDLPYARGAYETQVFRRLDGASCSLAELLVVG